MGPLFYHDLVRLARRGRSTLLRFIYGLFLLLALYAVYQQTFPHLSFFSRPFETGATLRPNQMARFSANFAIALIALQVVAVLVLTPAYLAGAIAEEHERRTLELLFTTHLTNREIILGKLFGRLGHLIGIMLTGLPILSLLQLWGGIDGSVLLAGAAVTIFTLLSVGSISILLSVLAKDSLQAVVLSYLVVFLVSLLSLALGYVVVSPFGFVLQLEDFLGVRFLRTAFLGPGAWYSQSGPLIPTTIFKMTLGYALIHGIAALICLLAAIVNLRGESLPPPRRRQVRPNPFDMENESALVVKKWNPPPVAEPASTREPSRWRYPVGDSALLWKEVYHGANAAPGWTFPAVYGVTVTVGLAFSFVAALDTQSPFWMRGQTSFLKTLAVFAGQAINPTLRGLGLFLASAWCLAVALQAAGCITREREQRTLAGLLMLPCGRSAILLAKLLGGPLRFRALGYGLAGIGTVGVLTGALHPGAVVLLAIAVVIHVAFLSSLGVWLSLVSRNTLWAYLSMVLMVLLVFAGSSVAMLYSEWLGRRLDEENWGDDFVEMGLNPLRVWWFLGFSWHDVWEGNVVSQKMRIVLFGLGVYAALAGLLWLAAWLRFRNQHESK